MRCAWIHTSWRSTKLTQTYVLNISSAKCYGNRWKRTMRIVSFPIFVHVVIQFVKNPKNICLNVHDVFICWREALIAWSVFKSWNTGIPTFPKHIFHISKRFFSYIFVFLIICWKRTFLYGKFIPSVMLSLLQDLCRYFWQKWSSFVSPNGMTLRWGFV